MSSGEPACDTEDRTAVLCDDVMDLATVSTMQGRLLAAMAAGGGDVTVRAHLVTRVDTSHLQLLCAAAHDLRSRGRTLRVAGATDAMVLTARRLGLAGVLGLADARAPTAPLSATSPAPPTDAVPDGTRI